MRKLIIVFGILLMVLGACSQRKQERILILGDSNGAASDGWVVQLERLCPEFMFCNLSIAGNTIGFDNLGQDTLNTLKNISSYIQRAKQQMGSIDKILVWLGTNDCKNVFDSLKIIVPEKFDSLLFRIESLGHIQGKELIVIAPPPYAPDSLLESKYYGGNLRLKYLVPKLEQVASRHHCKFVNLYDSLEFDFAHLNKDGVHLTAEGALQAATIIRNHLIRKE